MRQAKTIKDCLFVARRVLPHPEAEVLTTLALGVDRSTLYAFPEYFVSDKAAQRHKDWLARRVNGEPLAYISGEKEFWGLNLVIHPEVLVPRPETETVIECALPLTDSDSHVLDLGTGSGAIALALANETKANITAVDIRTECVDLCRLNADRLGLHVTVILSDWFSNISRSFDLIVSNPPYIAVNDPHLKNDGLTFEPDIALCGGKDGLEAIRTIITEAPSYLRSGGNLLIEHGHDQARQVASLFEKSGFTEIRNTPDIAGTLRVCSGTKP
ncbi:MAG: protein-(glutamine-N5) methyltransferase, release factor-specific [Gammaproteobacteria bacterium]|nr:protein-(glutamine-N5) methyltransferase, release factor-specific [Gammaproteobacteria bacterium]